MSQKFSKFRSNLPSYLVLLTNLAVITTALISYMTLRQMKAQTEASYRPDLVIQLPKQYFKLRQNMHPSRNYLPIMLADGQNPADTVYGEFLMAAPAFEIVNVGFGTARFVEMNWRFDGQFFLKNNELNIGGQGLHIQPFGKGGDIQFNRNATLPPFDETKLPYLLPTGGNAPQQFHLSRYYTLGWSSMVYQLVTSTLDKSEKRAKIPAVLAQMPPLALEVKYVDIGGVKHEKVFHFQWNAHTIDPIHSLAYVELKVVELKKGQAAKLEPYTCSFFLSEREWAELEVVL